MSINTPDFLPEATPIVTVPRLASGADPWGWWRDQMPVTRKWAYFDHAAVAPLPGPAAEALARFAQQAATEGDTVWPQWAQDLESLRSGTAKWLNASPDEIAFVPNTTFGINIVAESFRWKPGDNIVIPGGEFPSNLFPWQNQQRKGVELRTVPSPSGRVDLDGIRKAIDSRTRIVAASWVGYSTGYRLPLEDLCELVHRRGALLFLDAIQGLGPFALDLGRTPIDFLAADGHKWLLGPEGAGIAFVRQQHLELLDCASVGWNSVIGSHSFSGAQMDLKPSAARFEGGSQNMAGLMAMHASLKIFWEIASQFGPTAISDRVLELHSIARIGLRRKGIPLISDWQKSNRSGILTFVPRETVPAELRKRLADQKIAVSCRGGGVRLSIHAYNTASEIEHLLDCL